MSASVVWDELPANFKAEFIGRLERMDPQLDPRREWNNMTPKGRSDLRWHMERTPQALRDSWSVECERLRVLADEATSRAFRVLAEKST